MNAKAGGEEMNQTTCKYRPSSHLSLGGTCVTFYFTVNIPSFCDDIVICIIKRWHEPEHLSYRFCRNHVSQNQAGNVNFDRFSINGNSPIHHKR